MSKKFLAILIITAFATFLAGSFIGGAYNLKPEKSSTYEIKYVVFYTVNNIDTVVAKNQKGFYVGSDRGSNFIKHGSLTGQTLIITSAPIKVIHYIKY